MNVFFDVQGTLIGAGAARPGVREAFAELSGSGHGVYLWSSAGSGYARQAAETLDVTDLVLGCFDKHGSPPVFVDFAVDDQPGITGRYGGYTIPPFSGDPNDGELRRVIDLVRDTGGG